jgi:hypothetical protein
MALDTAFYGTDHAGMGIENRGSRVMTGMSQEDFDRASKEILSAWEAAETRDQGFKVIVEYGRKFGYKNVIAAIEGRVPKRYTREKTVDQWVTERTQEEAEA